MSCNTQKPGPHGRPALTRPQSYLEAMPGAAHALALRTGYVVRVVVVVCAVGAVPPAGGERRIPRERDSPGVPHSVADEVILLQMRQNAAEL